MTQVRLETRGLRSRVKHHTTKPLHSLYIYVFLDMINLKTYSEKVNILKLDKVKTYIFVEILCLKIRRNMERNVDRS